MNAQEAHHETALPDASWLRKLGSLAVMLLIVGVAGVDFGLRCTGRSMLNRLAQRISRSSCHRPW